MEIFKIKRITDGGDYYRKNATAYALNKGQVAEFGYGVNPFDAKAVATAFNAAARYYGNENKNPLFHFMLSFESETCDSVEKAVELSRRILDPLGEDHLMIVGIHDKEHENSSYHAHAVMCSTNLENGKMFGGTNKDLNQIAQRMADVTNNTCELCIDKKGGMKEEYKRIFSPSDSEDE